MDYKIIVLDLDGTLTNRDKIITPRTRDALMEAQKAGNIVVLASGRPTPGVEPLARELEMDRFGSYILSYNGGMITNCTTGNALMQSLNPILTIFRCARWMIWKPMWIFRYPSSSCWMMGTIW